MKPEKTDTVTLLILRRLYVDGLLTSQQYKTLRGQVLAGDTEGAEKGLRKILSRINGIDLIRRAVIDEVPG